MSNKILTVTKSLTFPVGSGSLVVLGLVALVEVALVGVTLVGVTLVEVAWVEVGGHQTKGSLHKFGIQFSM